MNIKHSTEILDIIRKDGDFEAVTIRIKDTGSANTAYPVNHSLGRVPVGCQIILKDRACDIYKGSRWNNNVIDLKFTASNADINLRIW